MQPMFRQHQENLDVSSANSAYMELPHIKKSDRLYGTAQPEIITKRTKLKELRHPTISEINSRGTSVCGRFSRFCGKIRKRLKSKLTCRDGTCCVPEEESSSMDEPDNGLLWTCCVLEEGDSSVKEHDNDSILRVLVTKVGICNEEYYLESCLRNEIAKQTGLSMRPAYTVSDNMSETERSDYQFRHNGMARNFGGQNHKDNFQVKVDKIADETNRIMPKRPGSCLSTTSKTSTDAESNLTHLSEDISHGMKVGDTKVTKRQEEMKDSIQGSFSHCLASNDNIEESVPKSFVLEEDANIPCSQNTFIGIDKSKLFLTEGVRTSQADVSIELSHSNLETKNKERIKIRRYDQWKLKTSFDEHLSFAYFHRCRRPLHTRMVNTVDSYSYPNYTDLEARRNSLADCTSQQLNGFTKEELAHAGWFFYHHIVTFCCGVEMPSITSGAPLDIHINLNSQCGFAVSLRESLQQISQQEGEWQASGGASQCKVPVQATDSGRDIVYDDDYSVYLTLYGKSLQGNILATDGQGVGTSLPSSRAMLVTNNTVMNTQSRKHPVPEQNSYSYDGQERVLLDDVPDSALRKLDLSSERESTSALPPLEELTLMDDEDDDIEGARYPNLGRLPYRMCTFEGWPVDHVQTPKMLSEAGFVYAGYGDSVLCYACGMGVRNWLPMDNPWIEHARWRPTCGFVKKMKGEHFINAVVELTSNSRHTTLEEVYRVAQSRETATLIGLPNGVQKK